MNNNYVIEYLNENEFRKKERTIRKYNMLAYKKLLFEHYPSLRSGIFPGTLVSINDADKTIKYELALPTDKTFAKVYGNIVLHYTVYQEHKIVFLETLTPEEVLTEGLTRELTIYGGTRVSKPNKDSDMFKINLLNIINKNG